MGAVGFELLDDRQQVAYRTGKPVQADDEQGFAGPDVTQQPG
jgi:hypothetical protein